MFKINTPGDFRCVAPDLFHAKNPFLLYLGLSGLAFATSLHTPRQRAALLLLILIPALLSLFAALYVPFAPSISLVWGQSLTGYVLHTISTLHPKKVPSPYPSVPGSACLGFASCFDFRYFRRIWLNPRLMRTNPMDQTSQERPKNQSRGVFLVLQLWKLLTYCIIQTNISPVVFNEVVIDILPDSVAPYQRYLW
ncbi:hypothetical protein N7536_011867 [Penicillium majusculum]|nr:hypothetical protein N7536_011867 [Penicillium majusculum]